MQVAHGGGMVAFSGASDCRSWKQFFDRWFQQHGWRAVVGRQSSRGGWYLQYAGENGRPAGSIDVRFGPDDCGQLSGFLIVNPPASNSTEEEKR